MKGLDTLIRLHQRELDRLRRELVQLETQKDKLITLAQKVQQEWIREQELAMDKPEMAAYMAGYTERVRKRQLEIAKEVAMTEVRITACRASIAESFGELKKYEVARDNERQRIAETQKRKEQQGFDELSLQRFTRRKE